MQGRIPRSQALPGNACPEALPPVAVNEAEPHDMRYEAEPRNDPLQGLILMPPLGTYP